MNGLCECGCGGITRLATRNDPKRGTIKGQYLRFIFNHQNRIRPGDEYTVSLSGCWLWKHALDTHGYAMRGNGKSRLVHIVNYESKFGAVPKGKMLDHKCNVRSCVNPDHLQPSTNAENVQRGKHVKLSPDAVRQIRELYSGGQLTQWDLANQFGVGQNIISRVIRRTAWINV